MPENSGSIVIGGIVPHPPIMVPEVGGREAGKVRRTQEALLELGRRIRRSGAETMVMISPHGPVMWDAVAVVTQAHPQGNLGRFGAPEAVFELDTDLVLASLLREELKTGGIPEVEMRHRFDYQLDHGVTAPLYWLQKGGVDLPVVICGMAIMQLRRLYGFGLAAQRAAAAAGRKVAVVASGDLSHRLSPEAPNGYDPMGAVFDEKVQEIVAAADPLALVRLDPVLIECAGECGLRPIVMLFGAFDGRRVEAEVLSYEAPFGVGYMVASLLPGDRAQERLFAGKMAEDAKAQDEAKSYLVRLAERAIEAYLDHGEKIRVRDIPPEFARRAGVFVCLKKGGLLRGCIGTVEPTQANIAEEVVENAISAATRDSRFDPVSPAEVADLTIAVDVLGEPEAVSGLEDLDPKRYGVIVSRGSRRGLLLPDLEGIDAPEQQVSIARRKAGIDPDEPVKLERFEVKRYY
ncbi:MAG TPA: AmmeMemoRadiSam system protein A [Desulfotomaculum sp.]|nr:AmmeMemoRadiSam system protein A [Desulfotomaculum sp.]